MELAKLQEIEKNLLERVEYPRIAGIIGLQEEVGELSGDVMDVEIYERTGTEKIEQGIANVLFSLVDLCNLYDIDLSAACEKRLEEVRKRVNDWESEHGEELKKKREKLD